MKALQFQVGVVGSRDLQQLNQSGDAGTVQVRNSRKVDRDFHRWRLEQRDEPIANGRRGIDIDVAGQVDHSTLCNDVGFVLVDVFSVVGQHVVGPFPHLMRTAPGVQTASILALALPVPDVSASDSVDKSHGINRLEAEK